MFGPVNVPGGGVNDEALGAVRDLAQSAKDAAAAAQTKANAVEQQVNSGGLLAAAFVAGNSAPSDTKLFWIDTTAKTGGLKYHNGSAWVGVPVGYTT